MFFFKKIASRFLFPVPVTIMALCMGLALLRSARRQRAGRLLIMAGAVLLVSFSFKPLPDMLLGPLEHRFPPLDVDRLTPAMKSAITHVVVLGGGHVSDPALPAVSQLTSSTLVRLVEGIRVHRLLPGSRLVLSGGSLGDPVSDAVVMSKAAAALGVPSSSILLENLSRDTKDQARMLLPVLGDRPFVLVTSASHMPRSVALFRHLGMQPVPAPAGHLAKNAPETFFTEWFPEARNIRKAERAVYEYLGTAWAMMRGLI